MKKTYVKPQVFFEDFQLSASIAAGCAYKTGHTMDICAYETAGKSIFVDEVVACTTTTQDGNWSGLCYHNPTDTTKLFTS